MKKSIDLSRVWTREPWISRRARYPETTEADNGICRFLKCHLKCSNVPLMFSYCLNLTIETASEYCDSGKQGYKCLWLCFSTGNPDVTNWNCALKLPICRFLQDLAEAYKFWYRFLNSAILGYNAFSEYGYIDYINQCTTVGSIE